MKYKKIIALLLGGLLFFSSSLSTAAETYQIRALHMYAHSYAVMDANTGKILFGENVDKQIYPASTAKLMSAIVAVESGVPLDTVIETESSIVNHTTPGTYNLGLHGGEHYTLSALLHMSLIASAADATDTMAAGLYGSRQAFAEKMMEKVNELGLTATSFDNPVGSDTGGGFYETYSTAREMCEITRYAMTLPAIRSIVRKGSYTISGDGSANGRTISNTNRFYSIYPYNKDMFTIIGSKTGQTTAAGNVFIATAVDKEGHELICAYFGRDTREQTFHWINNLLTYAFKNYKEGKLTLSKGAYNARYHAGSSAIARSMTAGIFGQNSDGTVDLQAEISQQQAISMIKSCLLPELGKTEIPSYMDGLNGTDAPCDPAFFTDSLKQAVPGLRNITSVHESLQNLSDPVTREEAATVLTSAISHFDFYEMSRPALHMQTWSMENPVPFVSVPVLPVGFLEEYKNMAN